MNRCPGSDDRSVTATDVMCPSCGKLVELFSDEQKRRCPHCGERVTREAVPTCATWCVAARQCLGADRYERMLESRMLALGGTTENDEG